LRPDARLLGVLSRRRGTVADAIGVESR
jgi:hypothetical protein